MHCLFVLFFCVYGQVAPGPMARNGSGRDTWMIRVEVFG